MTPLRTILADVARELLEAPEPEGPGIVHFIDDPAEQYETPPGQPRPSVVVYLPREGR